MRLFEDGCVVYREIANDYDAEMSGPMQKGLDTQLRFNADKCFVVLQYGETIVQIWGKA